jgi:hypothetical protein
MIAAAFAAFVLAMPASAQVNCQTFGNTTYCNDTSGNTMTCQRFGNQTYCN